MSFSNPELIKYLNNLNLALEEQPIILNDVILEDNEEIKVKINLKDFSDNNYPHCDYLTFNLNNQEITLNQFIDKLYDIFDEKIYGMKGIKTPQHSMIDAIFKGREKFYLTFKFNEETQTLEVDFTD